MVNSARTICSGLFYRKERRWRKGAKKSPFLASFALIDVSPYSSDSALHLCGKEKISVYQAEKNQRKSVQSASSVCPLPLPIHDFS
jgi:hypothetical protein